MPGPMLDFGGKGPEKQLWFLGAWRLGVGGWGGHRVTSRCQLEACGEDRAYPGMNSGTRVTLCVVPSQGGDPKAESLGARGGAAGAARTRLSVLPHSWLVPITWTLTQISLFLLNPALSCQHWPLAPASSGSSQWAASLGKP